MAPYGMQHSLIVGYCRAEYYFKCACFNEVFDFFLHCHHEFIFINRLHGITVAENIGVGQGRNVVFLRPLLLANGNLMNVLWWMCHYFLVVTDQGHSHLVVEWCCVWRCITLGGSLGNFLRSSLGSVWWVGWQIKDT
eukprot:12033501-Ditylum_brightwellii.AAC.1